LLLFFYDFIKKIMDTRGNISFVNNRFKIAFYQAKYL
jgi:hypothetical protein